MSDTNGIAAMKHAGEGPGGRFPLAGRPLGLLLGVALPGGALAAVYRALTPGEMSELPDGVDPAELPESFFEPLYPLPASLARGLFVLAVLAAAAALLYGLWALVRKRHIAGGVFVGVSAFYSAWLTLLLKNLYAGFSLSTTEPWLAVCALCVIPLFYSMAAIVLWLTPPDRALSPARSLLPLIAAPVLWYLTVNSLRYSLTGSARTVLLVLAVVVTYGFVFVVMRLLYLLLRGQDSARRAARAAVLFVLPLLGLLVTQMSPEFSFFWNFGSPLYYLLVVVNGVLLVLPEPGRGALRLLLFFGRCATYPFVLYFTVCLAPFYALSFVGILLFGLGLLVLAPLFLCIYQTRVLWVTGRALFSGGGLKTAAAALAGILVLPAAVTAAFYSDKANFSTAMHYLTDSAEEVGRDAGPVDIDKLEKSIDTVMRGGGEMSFQSISYYAQGYTSPSYERMPPPILSALHNRVVGAGDLVAGGAAYTGLRSLYFGWPGSMTDYTTPVKVEGNEDVLLEDVRVETVREDGYYRSLVHLTIREQTAVREAAEAAAREERREFEDVYTWGMEEEPYVEEDLEPDEYFDDYHSDYARRAEYATTIRLPQGVFISDYYLDVLGERKSGLLAERSSALWIYDTVVSSALDPGLVYYDGADVVLRVFPFERDEVRHTGIELLHIGPVSFDIDGLAVELAPEAAEPAAPVPGDGAVYVSAAAKRALPTVYRTPHYRFVVDCSQGADVEDYARRILAYCRREGIPPEAATVTALNYRRASWPMTRDDWEEQLLQFEREGGFAFGLAADAMCREFDEPDAYPVFVLVTDSVGNAILPRDTAYLEAVSPELYGYYRLPDQTPDEEDGTVAGLRLYLFQASPLLDRYPDPDGGTAMRVLELDGETRYLRDDGRPEVLPRPGGADGGRGESGWRGALGLMGAYQQSLELPGEARMTAQLEVVKDSFRAGLMTPLTSFIVLETRAQEELMLERQRRLLESGDLERSIDRSGDDEWVDSVETPEPSLLACALIAAGAVLVVRRRKKHQMQRRTGASKPAVSDL